MRMKTMPGELKPDALCPKCGADLDCLVDETSPGGVTRWLYHRKGSPKARRKRRCIIVYFDFETAQRERRKLETRPKVSKTKD